MNCYLSRNYKDTTSAGNKAKTDIEKTMESMGYRNIGLPQTTYSNKLAHFAMTLFGVLKAPFCLRKGDTLVLQYPLKKYYAFVCRTAHARGAKVITVIHDLGSFRRKALTVGQETRRLSHSDCIIAHNDNMRRHLVKAGCKAPVASGKYDSLHITVVQTPETLKLIAEAASDVVYQAIHVRKNWVNHFFCGINAQPTKIW